MRGLFMLSWTIFSQLNTKQIASVALRPTAMSPVSNCDNFFLFLSDTVFKTSECRVCVCVCVRVCVCVCVCV